VLRERALHGRAAQARLQAGAGGTGLGRSTRGSAGAGAERRRQARWSGASGAAGGRAAQAQAHGRRRAGASGWQPGVRAGARVAWRRRVSGTRAWRARASGAAGERGGVQAEEGQLQHTRDTGLGRTRHGRAWMALRRGKAGASAGPATGEGGVAVQGNDGQSDDVQDGDVQRMAVSPLSELRPRSSWCAGRSRAVQVELQCGGCGGIRTGAAGPRVEHVGTVEGKAADEVRRHCELLVEDMEVA
jgi:hypothetical protein